MEIVIELVVSVWQRVVFFGGALPCSGAYVFWCGRVWSFDMPMGSKLKHKCCRSYIYMYHIFKDM